MFDIKLKNGTTKKFDEENIKLDSRKCFGFPHESEKFYICEIDVFGQLSDEFEISENLYTEIKKAYPKL